MAIVALAGGVGGAKLADGLAKVLPAGELTVIVNIGDDFSHYGLHISPDLDTVMYTLAGIANPQTGWGLQNESWGMLNQLQAYGEDPWFGLGDRDLATHLYRTQKLAQGARLSEITTQMSQALGIQQNILPASDERFATMIDTEEAGTLPFQVYFVKHRWQPTAQRIWFDGNAQPSPAVISALDSAEAIIVCPSNPILSIDPILAIGDLRERLRGRRVPCIAVSPLIHGQALKGPAAKIMLELGYPASTEGILRYYEGLIDTLVVDQGDQAETEHAILETDILMKNDADRQRLAKEILGSLA